MSEEELAEIWDARGMKYRVDDLHQALINRGLTPHVDRPTFRKLVRDVFQMFLVDGKARRDPRWDPRPRFPKVY